LTVQIDQLQYKYIELYDYSWTTKIILPLKEEMKIHMRSLAARFNDIHPSLLLFLHRLREITIDNRVSINRLREITIDNRVSINRPREITIDNRVSINR
jgi:hypothetical protein